MPRKRPEEHPNISKKDWRFQAITTLAEPFTGPSGIKHEIGAPIILVDMLNYNGTVQAIPIPNMIAIYLHQSQLSFELANSIRSRKGFIENECLIFDYIEAKTSSIIFAYSALEAFANEYIPDTFDYVINSKGKLRTLNKLEIEKTLSLKDKIGSVMPQVFSLRFSKRDNLWNNFIELENIRHRIIHLKSSDRKSMPPNTDTIWKQLILKHNNYQKDAVELIRFFLGAQKEPPRWLGRMA